MLEGIIYSIVLVFMIIGIVSSLYFVMLRVLHPKSANKYTMVIAAQAGEKDIAGIMCAASMRLSLLGDNDRSRIVVVDCGIDESERTMCENICRDSNEVYICDPSELEKYVLDEM